MRKTLLLLTVLSTPLSLAAEPAGKSLSGKGQSRLRENLRIIKQNITTTEKNLTTAKQNIETIETDLKELERLSAQSSSLQKKHQDYLASLQSELSRNESSLKQLSQFEASGRGPSSTGTVDKADLERAERERQERQKWKAETEAKLTQTRSLLEGVGKNLSTIAVRQKSLNEQRLHWENRVAEHQKLLAQFQIKKREVESLLKK